MYTDIHSHILPGIDDGAENLDEAILLIKKAAFKGTDKFIATPHFYAAKHSLEERIALAEERYKQLCKTISEVDINVRIGLGFEVRFFKGISSCDQLDRMTLGNSKFILLELGPEAITDSIISEITELYYFGYNVILAHLERYTKNVGFNKLKPLIKNSIVSVQVNAASFVEAPFVRVALKFLKKGIVDYIASDMHSLRIRPSKLDKAMEIIEKKIGTEAKNILIDNSNRLFSNIT